MAGFPISSIPTVMEKGLLLPSLRLEITSLEATQVYHGVSDIPQSFNGLKNSINWPASNISVFIAQAGRALQC